MNWTHVLFLSERYQNVLRIRWIAIPFLPWLFFWKQHLFVVWCLRTTGKQLELPECTVSWNLQCKE